MALNNEIGVEVGSLFVEEERCYLYKAHTAEIIKSEAVSAARLL